MNTIFKTIAAAAVAAGFFATAASAASVAPSQQGNFQGVVIVPASANPMQETTPKAAKKQFERGTVVKFNSDAAKGSIIINTKQNKLYLVLGGGKALMFPVATARKGFEWQGTHKVSMKTEWPSWTPPKEMRARHPELPKFMKGGKNNPLGARAIYLGSSLYRIHGTNEPKSIGRSASSGCIRMLNADVIYLYSLVKLGAQVTVI
ncbi:MAG TPA: L,D-transpeptidase [Aestuariivirga sp.]|nr:L,D-transpeptidase [Aestuariivirga sp.]